ncbi:MAG: hypothetical protein DMF94_02610 [Acidobacteria bacterium]|nr:MAG: hypothetical protein DMF94_02610 [Acidobacteriota bacterium]
MIARGERLLLSIEHRAAPSQSGLSLALGGGNDALALAIGDAPPVRHAPPPSPRNKIEDVLAHTNQPVTVAELRQACRMRTTHVCQACSRSRAAFTGFESRSP